MSRPRPNFGRGARAGGWFGGALMKVDHAQGEREAAAGIAAAQAETPIVRVAHPVVRTLRNEWYRVIREYRGSYGIAIEDIGEAPTFDAARAIAASEIGRARVLSPWSLGKVRTVYDNLQPIEERG